MHIICGYVNSKTAGAKDAHSWYATGIIEIKNLLNYLPRAFQEDYQFITEATTVSDKITSSTTNEFETSNLVFITLLIHHKDAIICFIVFFKKN